MNNGNPTEFDELASMTLIQDNDNTWTVFISPRTGGTAEAKGGFQDPFECMEYVNAWLDGNKATAPAPAPAPELAAEGTTEGTRPGRVQSQANRPSRPRRKTPGQRKPSK